MLSTYGSEVDMTASLAHQLGDSSRPAVTAVKSPRFGGLFWRLARVSNSVTVPLGGHRGWPLFAIIRHQGRRSGRTYETIVAARRIADGFVISLAFGAQVDWFRNLEAAGSCVVRWEGADYHEVRPEVIDWATARSAFHPIQRLFIALAGIHGFIRLSDAR
jgi:deazaflavin-dependent oxidoreductase (nitroreductase family)